VPPSSFTWIGPSYLVTHLDARISPNRFHQLAKTKLGLSLGNNVGESSSRPLRGESVEGAAGAAVHHTENREVSTLVERKRRTSRVAEQTKRGERWMYMLRWSLSRLELALEHLRPHAVVRALEMRHGGGSDVGEVSRTHLSASQTRLAGNSRPLRSHLARLRRGRCIA
jgi:hypothetical protein